MHDKHKENLCFSRVRGGPGAQVGATWATESVQVGPGVVKVEVKAAKEAQSWAGQVGLAVRVMQPNGTQPNLRQGRACFDIYVNPTIAIVSSPLAR